MAIQDQADLPGAVPANAPKRRKVPQELSILLVMVGIALVFEALGWWILGESFLLNEQRLRIIILQMSVIGIIAVGVTQVIITAGIDLSSGSIVGISAMVAASLAQNPGYEHAIYPGLTGLNPVIPAAAGLAVGIVAGLINGLLIAKTGIPPFIATLGMYVSARGMAIAYTRGQPVGVLSDSYSSIGGNMPAWALSIPVPVIIFLVVAAVFHIALRYTRYGKFTYAIGANAQAARVSGINLGNHLIKVYTVAGFLSGLAGVVTSARVASGQTAMGTGYELDAIAATVIGGTSLAGGAGRITGTVIGVLILGIVISGFTFLRVDAYYQQIIKGGIIVLAVIVDQYRQKRRKGV